MKIVVLLKQVPDTYGERTLDLTSGRVERDAVEPVIDEINERALEAALSYKDANKGTEVALLTMGPASAKDSLKKGLSMGADSAVHILDDSLAGSDAIQTAQVLAASLRKIGFDLIVAGNESTDGSGGVVPAAMAELLQIPLLGFLTELEITAESVHGARATDTQSLNLEATLPAIVTVTESLPDARFPNFKGIMSARKKPMEVIGLPELEVDLAGTKTIVTAVAERPARTGGVRIIDTGDAAAQLADFLATNRLI